MYIIIIK